MKNKMKWVFTLVVILLLVPWLVTYALYDDDITVQDTGQIAPAGPSVASGLTNTQEPSHGYSYSIPKSGDYNAVAEFPFRIFVTPEGKAIEALAAQVNGPRDAYKIALQWTYVSEQKLNQVAEKWLTPHEFLTNTPHYPSNPLEGKEVSDCEEQANTLVSLVRAVGIRPEEVRVALGELKVSNGEVGHAWVELLINGHWLVLDPSSGPYWDDEVGELISRRGVPFDYYAQHTYPVVRVWAYYNDIYYLDLRDSSGYAPASWR